MLSNYPKLFEKDVIIVIGSDTSQIVIEGFDAIAENLFNLTGSMSAVETADAGIAEDELAVPNLIHVGGPNSTKVLGEIYERKEARN